MCSLARAYARQEFFAALPPRSGPPRGSGRGRRTADVAPPLRDARPGARGSRRRRPAKSRTRLSAEHDRRRRGDRRAARMRRTARRPRAVAAPVRLPPPVRSLDRRTSRPWNGSALVRGSRGVASRANHASRLSRNPPATDAVPWAAQRPARVADQRRRGARRPARCSAPAGPARRAVEEHRETGPGLRRASVRSAAPGTGTCVMRGARLATRGAARSALEAAEDQRAVGAAEAEGVRQRGFDRSLRAVFGT